MLLSRGFDRSCCVSERCDERKPHIISVRCYAWRMHLFIMVRRGGASQTRFCLHKTPTHIVALAVAVAPRREVLRLPIA